MLVRVWTSWKAAISRNPANQHNVPWAIPACLHRKGTAWVPGKTESLVSQPERPALESSGFFLLGPGKDWRNPSHFLGQGSLWKWRSSCKTSRSPETRSVSWLDFADLWVMSHESWVLLTHWLLGSIVILYWQTQVSQWQLELLQLNSMRFDSCIMHHASIPSAYCLVPTMLLNVSVSLLIISGMMSLWVWRPWTRWLLHQYFGHKFIWSVAWLWDLQVLQCGISITKLLPHRIGPDLIWIRWLIIDSWFTDIILIFIIVIIYNLYL